MAAEDAFADAVLDGTALVDVVGVVTRRGRRGWFDGLDQVRRAVAERRAVVRSAVDAAILAQLQDPLGEAVRLEYRTLFADPDDLARLEEAELVGLPAEPAAAWQALHGRTWRSPAAEVSFQQARQVVEAMHEAAVDRAVAVLDGVDAVAVAAVGEELDLAGDAPTDGHRWRRSAQGRLLAALAPAPARRLRLAWTNLVGRHPGLADAVRQWHRSAGWGGLVGPEADPDNGAYLFTLLLDPVAELADLDRLEHAVAQDHPGAGLDDIDADDLERTAGAEARRQFDALRRAVHAVAVPAVAAPGGAVDLAAVRRRVPAMALRRGITPDLRRRLGGPVDDSPSRDGDATILVVLDRTGPVGRRPELRAAALAVGEVVRRHRTGPAASVVVVDPGGQVRVVRPDRLLDLPVAPDPAVPADTGLVDAAGVGSGDRPGPVGAVLGALRRTAADADRVVVLVLGDAALGAALGRACSRWDWKVRPVPPSDLTDPYQRTTATIRSALTAVVA